MASENLVIDAGFCPIPLLCSLFRAHQRMSGAPVLHHRQQSPSGQVQIHQPTGHEQPLGVLVQTPVAYLAKAEHALEGVEGMLDSGAHLRLGAIHRLVRLAQRMITSSPFVGEVARLRGVFANDLGLARTQKPLLARCFDMRVPEEINRRIVDHTADVNLTYSNIAREYLLREGLPPDRIIKTGSPMCEVLDFYAQKIKESDVLVRLGLQEGRYFVVSAHREENIDSDVNCSGLVEILNGVARHYDMPVIVSTHPRTRKRFEAMGYTLDSRVQVLKPLGFTDYVKLQTASKAVLSDSGTISEEASILDLRALNLRETHERPEAMEEAAVMMVGMRMERVLQGLEILESQPSNAQRLLRQVADYSMPNVSEKVIRIIYSYVDYVNRTVWKKY